MRFTIITPNLNYGRFLGECLQSVASQQGILLEHDETRAERQHVESRAIRRAYGITLFKDPYLNGRIDGILWIVAKGWKTVLRCFGRSERIGSMAPCLRSSSSERNTGPQ